MDAFVREEFLLLEESKDLFPKKNFCGMGVDVGNGDPLSADVLEPEPQAPSGMELLLSKFSSVAVRSTMRSRRKSRKSFLSSHHAATVQLFPHKNAPRGRTTRSDSSPFSF